MKKSQHKFIKLKHPRASNNTHRSFDSNLNHQESPKAANGNVEVAQFAFQSKRHCDHHSRILVAWLPFQSIECFHRDSLSSSGLCRCGGSEKRFDDPCLTSAYMLFSISPQPAMTQLHHRRYERLSFEALYEVYGDFDAYVVFLPIFKTFLRTKPN